MPGKRSARNDGTQHKVGVKQLWGLSSYVGRKSPPLDVLPAWAKALGLRVSQRAAFLLLGHLEQASPMLTAWFKEMSRRLLQLQESGVEVPSLDLETLEIAMGMRQSPPQPRQRRKPKASRAKTAPRPPIKTERRQKRNVAIVEDLKAGIPMGTIARKHGITRQAVSHVFITETGQTLTSYRASVEVPTKRAAKMGKNPLPDPYACHYGTDVPMGEVKGVVRWVREIGGKLMAGVEMVETGMVRQVDAEILGLRPSDEPGRRRSP